MFDINITLKRLSNFDIDISCQTIVIIFKKYLFRNFVLYLTQSLSKYSCGKVLIQIS